MRCTKGQYTFYFRYQINFKLCFKTCFFGVRETLRQVEETLPVLLENCQNIEFDS